MDVVSVPCGLVTGLENRQLLKQVRHTRRGNYLIGWKNYAYVLNTSVFYPAISTHRGSRSRECRIRWKSPVKPDSEIRSTLKVTVSGMLLPLISEWIDADLRPLDSREFGET